MAIQAIHVIQAKPLYYSSGIQVHRTRIRILISSPDRSEVRKESQVNW